MIEILCRLSEDFAVDWEFNHDHDPGPIGFIRSGECEPRLREQVEAFGDLGGILQEIREDFELLTGGSPSTPSGTHEGGPDDYADGDEGPNILPFRPRGS
jgi:hypothetical protein